MFAQFCAYALFLIHFLVEELQTGVRPNSERTRVGGPNVAAHRPMAGEIVVQSCSLIALLGAHEAASVPPFLFAQ